jgi:hypothetical protein
MSGTTEDGAARGRRLGRRYALAVFIAFSAGFIVLSTSEVIAGVFSLDAPGGAAAHGTPDDACTKALTRFAASVERGSRDAALAAAADSACADRGPSLDALAAARRVERAVEAARRSRPEQIAALRKDLDAYLAR